jgi:hypothetical protein
MTCREKRDHWQGKGREWGVGNSLIFYLYIEAGAFSPNRV